MFNFLIICGLFFIILGLYGEKHSGKDEITNEEKIYAKIMQNIEPIIESIVELQEESQRVPSFEDVLGRINEPTNNEATNNETINNETVNDEPLSDESLNNKPSYNKETFKIIEQYEAGDYTLDEVCKILKMKKGEVLLLRNIYKKFQN